MIDGMENPGERRGGRIGCAKAILEVKKHGEKRKKWVNS